MTTKTASKSKLLQAYENNKKFQPKVEEKPLDVHGLADMLTGSAILRKALTTALNKNSMVPGTVVQLKSGGPKMVIQTIMDKSSSFDGFVSVRWFPQDYAEPLSAYFRPECLQLVQP